MTVASMFIHSLGTAVLLLAKRFALLSQTPHINGKQGTKDSD